MGIDRCMAFLVHSADPFRQQTIKRHGNHDARHTDIAVMHDLMRVQDVAQANDDHNQWTGCQRNGNDVGP